MRRRRIIRLINRWYLLFGGAVVLLGTGNVLFNATIRESLGLSPEPVKIGAWVSSLFGHDSAGGPTRIEPAPREVLEAFASSFQAREVGRFALPAPQIKVTAAGDGGEAAGKIQAEILAAEEARAFLPWPVRVKGFGEEPGGTRGAYIGKGAELCTVGRAIRSRSPGNCLYRVIAVLDECVWLQALEGGAIDAPPPLPSEVSWPGVLRIEMAAIPGHPGETRPDAVVLADGSRVKEGGRCTVAGPGGAVAEYTVRRIWRRGVCFDISLNSEGGATCRLVCMLADR